MKALIEILQFRDTTDTPVGNEENNAVKDWRGVQPDRLGVFNQEDVSSMASSSPLCDPSIHAIAELCLNKFWNGDKSCFEDPLNLIDIQDRI